MCEPFLPIQNEQHPIVPIVVLRWPEGVEGERLPLGEDSILRHLHIYEVDYDEMGEEGWEPTERPQLRTF
jgi:hypothetical protein